MLYSHCNKNLMDEGHQKMTEVVVVQVHGNEGNFSPNGYSDGHFDKPLPCFGCGMGWFSFILGFVFPPLWYFATLLYFGNQYFKDSYLKDPRERPGLAASAIAALICSVGLLISGIIVFVCS